MIVVNSGKRCVVLVVELLKLQECRDLQLREMLSQWV